MHTFFILHIDVLYKTHFISQSSNIPLFPYCLSGCVPEVRRVLCSTGCGGKGMQNIFCVATHTCTQALLLSGSMRDPSGYTDPCLFPLHPSRSCTRAGQQPFFPTPWPLWKLHQWQQQRIGNEYQVMSDAWYIVGSLGVHVGGQQEFGSLNNTSWQCFSAFFWDTRLDLAQLPI